jgi:hypothetical protein
MRSTAQAVFRDTVDIYLAEFVHSLSIRNWLAIHKPLVRKSRETSNELGNCWRTITHRIFSTSSSIRRRRRSQETTKARTKTHKRTNESAHDQQNQQHYQHAQQPE